MGGLLRSLLAGSVVSGTPLLYATLAESALWTIVPIGLLALLLGGVARRGRRASTSAGPGAPGA